MSLPRQGPVRHGVAVRGWAWLGMARRSATGLGAVGHGVARYGMGAARGIPTAASRPVCIHGFVNLAGLDLAWPRQGRVRQRLGAATRGMVRRGVAWQGAAGLGKAPTWGRLTD